MLISSIKYLKTLRKLYLKISVFLGVWTCDVEISNYFILNIFIIGRGSIT